MESLFKIYVDRLKDSEVEKIDLQVTPTFLEVNDEELSFQNPVTLSGEAYLASDHLILQLKARTQASMPCSICNNQIEISIAVENSYHSIPLAELKGAIFDYTELLREAILLQAPQFTECQNGKCPERENVKKFLKKPSTSTHFPFAEL